jgi:hypothetical protein
MHVVEGLGSRVNLVVALCARESREYADVIWQPSSFIRKKYAGALKFCRLRMKSHDLVGLRW